ncbi:MAG: phosphotransferase [Bifidobacteriaceae bacterium]|jgi:thiamine kinase-like enzyme|nr:phosphotransferase [Bifidobacteriaceae bacterium]
MSATAVVTDVVNGLSGIGQIDGPPDDNRRQRRAIAKLLGVPAAAPSRILPLTGGMTNTCYTFELDGRRYVLRLPGLGTENIIDRKGERRAYKKLRPHNLTDEVIALDKRGRRVTVFHEDARVADVFDDADLATAMSLVRRLHALDLALPQRFDMAGQIARYERLCAEIPPAPYPRLERQRRWAARLLRFRRQLAVPEVFCHGDMACDNVLILGDGGSRLIDWEYSGRADPIMDVAMCGMYSFMPRERLELALRLYLERPARAEETARLYLYLALSGYLWSLWAHYKTHAGEDYGDYGPKTNAYMLQYYPLLADSDLMGRALAERAALAAGGAAGSGYAADDVRGAAA